MYKQTHLFLFLIVAFILSSCHSKSNHATVEEEEYNYPVTIIPDTIRTTFSDTSKLYPVQEEFVEYFLEKAGDYQGHHVQARCELPEEWGVLCVERLPNGRELMLMQSKSREWKYLIITSGYGTQRILDLMPIAVNVAVQNDNILETEKWKTFRKPDGSFFIEKQYEWTRSVNNATKQQVLANPENYHRQASYVEQYFINDDGRFEACAEIDTLPDYNAVVFYYNRNEKPEAWDDCVEQLQSFCEENNILFEEVYQNYNQVTIQNYDFSFSIQADITPYVKNSLCGMVMMKKGAEPTAINFGSFEYMQMEIKRYFKIKNATVVI